MPIRETPPPPLLRIRSRAAHARWRSVRPKVKPTYIFLLPVFRANKTIDLNKNSRPRESLPHTPNCCRRRAQATAARGAFGWSGRQQCEGKKEKDGLVHSRHLFSLPRPAPRHHMRRRAALTTGQTEHATGWRNSLLAAARFACPQSNPPPLSLQPSSPWPSASCPPCAGWRPPPSPRRPAPPPPAAALPLRRRRCRRRATRPCPRSSGGWRRRRIR